MVPSSPRGVTSIPPFYPLKTLTGTTIQRRRKLPRQSETWEPLPVVVDPTTSTTINTGEQGMDDLRTTSGGTTTTLCVRDQVTKLLQELQILPPREESFESAADVTLPLEVFVRITKEVCHFPSFFNGPLYQRIIDLWNMEHKSSTAAETKEEEEEDNDELTEVTLSSP